MTRLIGFLLVALMVMSAAAVYDMKYEAEAGAERVAQLERQITNEQETLSRLKAEWSVLTQPLRLETLVNRHADLLKLRQMDATQIATISELPVRTVAQPVDNSVDPIGDLVAKLPGLDPVHPSNGN